MANVALPLPRDPSTGAPYLVSATHAQHVARGSSGIDLRTLDASGRPVVGVDAYALMPGVVERIGVDWRSGRYLTLRSASGARATYAHLSDVALPEGARVAAGQLIAWTGDTGQATGPHLHLEVDSPSGEPVDPEPILVEAARARSSSGDWLVPALVVGGGLALVALDVSTWFALLTGGKRR